MTGCVTTSPGRRTFWWLLAVATLAPAPSPGAAAEVDFSRDVLPILSTNCFPCHGPDAAKRKADFRLDDRDSATNGKAIVPGKPESSALLARLTAADDDGRMPPPRAGARASRRRTWRCFAPGSKRARPTRSTGRSSGRRFSPS